jgi:hypothetical protein
MTHTPITTYNSKYPQLTQSEGVTFVGGGVLSDNQGVSTITNDNNKRRYTESISLGGDCHVCTNTNITI